MNILYDYSIFIHQNLGGISRYFINLDKEINKTFKSNIIAPIHYNKFLNEYSQYEGIYIKKFPKFTEKILTYYNQFITEKFVNSKSPDIYHKTYYNNFWPKKFKGKKFLTVYDLIHEKFYFEYGYPSNFRPKKESLQNADKVFAISHNTKKDLIEFYDVPEKKIFVTHLGINLENTHSTKRIVNSPYILFVGDRKRYKNFKNLLRAFAISKKIHDNFKLVIFGGGNFFDEEKNLIKTYRLDKNQLLRIDGDDNTLSSLYKNANLFIFPSKYEGFGLPLLEAASNNCPIACSKIDVFQEIMGKNAIYFDPNSVEDISSSLEKVLFSDVTRKNLVNGANSILSNFSWSKCAKETLDFYKI